MTSEDTIKNNEPESVPTVRKNVENGRFELISSDGEVISYATFSQADQLVTVPLVFTPPEHRGAGHAATLMAGLLALIKADDQQIKPVCSYAVAYVGRHPEYQELVV